MHRNLADLPLHTPALVEAVGGDRAFRRRLLEMGMVPGTQVEKTKIAPMGDPIEISLRGARISIRLQEARAVTLREVGP
jgi:Fe2+ transport system protein FeoA